MRAQISSAADMGRLVRYVRNHHGVSQRDLAQRLGVTQRWLSELESGKGKQLNDRYFRVLTALGVRLDAEVHGIDEPPAS
ncbi:helix-turn-helix domain-containing protein [Brevibacterium yomogidense]|uniref:helix-turn-helix domain-containing protein n=1 Tax=Brevibacterium yomogidense TaxID=946573 RepID=UPI0018DFF223|nr:helix-turn-helix transcriptional regulator [Brevibacterium yomogidense]